MKLKTAATILYFSVLSFLILSAFLFIRSTNVFEENAKKLATAGESIHVAEELKSKVLGHNRNTFLYGIHKSNYYAINKERLKDEVDRLLIRMKKLVNSSEEQIVYNNFARELENYFIKRDEFSQTELSPTEQYGQVGRYLDFNMRYLDQLIEINRLQLNNLAKEIDQRNRNINSFSITLLTLASLFLGGTVVFIIRFVVNPLEKIASQIELYSKGIRQKLKSPPIIKEIKVIESNFEAMMNTVDSKRQDLLLFIASIAHDLKNPLNTVSMATEMLLKKSKSDEQEILSIIHQQIHGLDRLITDLIDTTRIESSEIEITPIPTGLDELIDESIKLHQRGTNLHSIQFKNQMGHVLCLIDPRRINQVLGNLLSNAIKYSPSGGHITVELTRNEGNLLVKVSDEGIGVNSKEYDSIFRPFHRSEQTKSSIPGIGLGLSASRKIVEAHGGRLTVRSEGLKGSTFIVSLPIYRYLDGSHSELFH